MDIILNINNVKRVAISLAMLLSSLSATDLCAQNQDSVTLISAEWQSEVIADGILLKQHHFKNNSLFNSNQYISILEINPKKVRKESKLNILAVEGLDLTSKVASESDAVVAVNGSFFNIRPPYNSVDYVRVDGKDLGTNRSDKSGKRLFTQEGSIVIKGRKLSIVAPSEELNSESRIKGEDILTAGPLLRLDNKNIEYAEQNSFYGRHPRTLIGVKKGGVVLLITVDGRNGEAAGMSMVELQKLVTWLGAKDALNLDGGGSTTMWTKERGVVNHPSDNKVFDTKGERKVSNMVVVN